MSQLEFDESTARRLDVLYGRRDVLRRRPLVRDALGVAPGDSILESPPRLSRLGASLGRQVDEEAAGFGADIARKHHDAHGEGDRQQPQGGRR